MPSTYPVGPDDSVVVHGSKRDPKKVTYVKDGDVKQKLVDSGKESFTSDAAIVVEEAVPDEPRPGLLHDNVDQKVAASSSKKSDSKSSSNKSSSSSKK